MKLKIIFLFFLSIYITIVIRLFYIQVINPKKYTSDLYLKNKKLYPERGKIYDRNGHPLVLNENSYLLYIEPKQVKDKYELFKQLSQQLKIDEASLEAKFDPSKYYIAIKSGIDDQTKKNIDRLNLKGIGYEYQMERYYPEASLSSHLLGFVGKNDINEDVGYFGIEGFYDKDLSGMTGFLQSERDLTDRPIFVGIQKRVEPENGRNLYLTIDKTVQEITKNILKDGLERYQAKQGCVITANPQTMEILGFVCLPDFDQKNYSKFTEEFFRNPGITELYEPGSTFKPLIVAASLQEKKIKPLDVFDETGPVSIGEYTIKTWNDKYGGKSTITQILERSSNVGMVWIGDKLGRKKTYQYLKDYGFGTLTNIDLQGEASGYIKPMSDWYDIDFATVSFGQGIAVTPIQMVKAFSSIINGGKVLKPQMVKQIEYKNDKIDIKPKIEKKILSETTSEIIRKMLVSTVENGEHQWDIPQGYSIGGKTGTAQIAISGHYDPSKTVASFIGFFPSHQPKIISLVMLKEPKSSQWGSETAAPLFFEIAKELIVYYNIVPEP